jgi:hypothetical protein
MAVYGGGALGSINEIAIIDILHASHYIFEADSEVGIRALDGKGCKSIRMSEHEDLIMCGAPVISGGAESRSARLAVCEGCRSGGVAKIQEGDVKVSERAGRLVIGQSGFLLWLRDARGLKLKRSAMMEAAEVLYLLEALGSRKEVAGGCDGVKVFTDLMTSLMDPQADLQLDPMSMSDSSSEASWMCLFLESEANTTNRRIVVRRDDLSQCWEEDIDESERINSVYFYDGDSANMSSQEGRAEREAATRSELDTSIVLDMLTGEASLFDQTPASPSASPSPSLQGSAEVAIVGSEQLKPLMSGLIQVKAVSRPRAAADSRSRFPSLGSAA